MYLYTVIIDKTEFVGNLSDNCKPWIFYIINLVLYIDETNSFNCTSMFIKQLFAIEKCKT